MRIVRLLMVVFALSVTALSAATQSPGSFGRQEKGRTQTRQAGGSGWYYYCYRDGIHKSCSGYQNCLDACRDDCDDPCNFEG